MSRTVVVRGCFRPHREVTSSLSPFRTSINPISSSRRCRRPVTLPSCFLRILRVGIDDPEQSFAEVVPSPDYRSTFLKLTRNLAPDGTTCKSVDIRADNDSHPISLDPGLRLRLGSVIRSAKQGKGTTAIRRETTAWDTPCGAS